MIVRKSAFLTLAFCLLPALSIVEGTFALTSVGGQARDVAVRPTGTASISGIVVTDDANPRPLRRATVIINTGDIRLPDTAMTDDNGAFAFAGLAAGNYSLVVTRGAYVQSFYGAKKPGKGPGVPIAVLEGQQVTNIVLKALHGSVIAGTVRDQNGQPLVGLQVQLTEVQMVNGQRRATLAATGSATTDDRGVYRAFGLPPGAYLVAAAPAGFGLSSSEARQVTPDDVRWAQQATGSSLATPGMAAPPIPPLPEPGPTLTYTSVYYPGTADPAGATPVTVGPNEEREGVDFTAVLVPTAKVSGTIVDPNGQIPQSAQVSLVPVLSDSSDMLGLIVRQISGLSARSVQDGKFSVTGVTPGRYKLTARGTPFQPGGQQPPGGGARDLAIALAGRMGGLPGGATGTLWAVEEITVDGREISGLSLRLQPGMSITGKIVYEASTQKPPTSLATTRLMLSPLPASGSQSDTISSVMNAVNATIADDGTFTVKGVLPDKYRAAVFGPGMMGGLASLAGALNQGASMPVDTWTLKSIVLNGRDVTDVSFEVKPGEDIAGLVITLTDRPTELSGRLIDRAGRPAPGFPIVVFSTDRTQWAVGSRRVRQVRPASDGKFTITGLPAGEYFVCPVTDLDPNDLSDLTFLEQLAVSALKVTLADGEKKTQDLRLAGGS
jgi:hypothetical protein